MPKIQDTRLAACDPGRSRKKLEKSSEFHWEFQEFERRAPRSFKTRPVDKSVDNVDNWEFGEFGSLTKRTYRYDYHASSIGWDITR